MRTCVKSLLFGYFGILSKACVFCNVNNEIHVCLRVVN